MKENKPLVLEICGFDEIGYPLATTQGELTTIQKLFLNHAYPLYREHQKEAQGHQEYESGGGNVTPGWKDNYKKRLEANRQRHLEREMNKKDGGGGS